jgi:type II restriction enzyme
VTSILEWSTKRLNSRKSRRGRSLQGHFEHLLRRERIPFTPECVTAEPPPADIMIPSCADYHDSAFPADKLRLVSCKSTLKERWMEVVPEAGRIEMKYLLTLDDKVTDNVLTALDRAKIRTFIPAPIIERAYSGRVTRRLLSSVTDLIAELRAVAG